MRDEVDPGLAYLRIVFARACTEISRSLFVPPRVVRQNRNRSVSMRSRFCKVITLQRVIARSKSSQRCGSRRHVDVVVYLASPIAAVQSASGSRSQPRDPRSYRPHRGTPDRPEADVGTHRAGGQGRRKPLGHASSSLAVCTATSSSPRARIRSITPCNAAWSGTVARRVVSPSLVETSRSSNAAETARPASPLKVITYVVGPIRPGNSAPCRRARRHPHPGDSGMRLLAFSP